MSLVLIDQAFFMLNFKIRTTVSLEMAKNWNSCHGPYAERQRVAHGQEGKESAAVVHGIAKSKESETEE
jgi:hypothetical protein